MFELLGSMGVDIVLDESMKFSVDSSNIKNFEARYELVKTMRASILVWELYWGGMVKQKLLYQVDVLLGQGL